MARQDAVEDTSETTGKPSFMRGLFDLRFSHFLTTDMLPAVYVFGIFISALWTVYVVVWAFHESQLAGLAWLMLLGPAMFLAMVVTIRMLLEFILIVFRIALSLDAVDSKVDNIVGQTEEIHHDIPRLRFWRKQGK